MSSPSSLAVHKALAFALPTLPVYLIYGSITIVQGIYVKYFGLTLSEVAKIILIARLVDALTDPVIGYFSDRYYLNRATRKIFVFVGATTFVISSYYLYVPPPIVSGEYFLFWLVMFYISWTLFEIPHMSWGNDIAYSYYDKNRIYGIRIFGVFIGYIFFFAIPLMPIFEVDSFTPKTLKWSVILAGLLMIPSLLLCCILAPSRTIDSKVVGKNDLSQSYNSACHKGDFDPINHAARLIKLIISNIPFRYFIISFLFVGIGTGMWFSLLYIYVDSYLGLGEHLPFTYLIAFMASVIFLAILYKPINKLDKKYVWISGMTLVFIGLLGTGFMSYRETGLWFLIVCTSFIYVGFIILNVMAPSLLADISDYGTLKNNNASTGLYFSIYTLTNKTSAAIGAAIGLMIPSRFGFDPTSSTHSTDALFGITIAISWLPALTILLSMIFIWFIPITAHRHSIIRRRLTRRSSNAY